MLLHSLIYVAVVPVATAACASLFARLVRLDTPIAWALGYGLGYVAGQLGLASRAGFDAAIDSLLHPNEAAEWLPHAVLLAIFATILFRYLPRRWRPAAVGLAGLLVLGVPYRLLAGSSYDMNWSTVEKLTHIAPLVAAFGATWLALGTADTGKGSFLRPALLILVAAATALVVALSGTLVYGELGAAAAAALAATLLLVRDGRVDGAAGAVTFSLGGLLMLGYFYGSLTATNALLLLAALLFAGCRTPGTLAASPAWQQSALRITLTLIPLFLAIGRAILTAQADMSSNPYGA